MSARHSWPTACAAALLMGACGPAARNSPPPDAPPSPAPAPTTLFTAEYTLEQRVLSQIVPSDALHPGGGFVRLGDTMAVMTGRGRLFRLAVDPSAGDVDATALPLGSPLDLDQFAATAPATANRGWFRAHGALARAVPDGWRIFVAHHVWSADRACVAVAVSAATIDAALATVVDDWAVVTELRPCLPVGGEVRGVAFAGHEAGGRMQWDTDGTLLLTTGDHQFDGLNRPIAAAQRDDYDYGKVLRLDVSTGAVSQVSKGHRNPQGLLLASDGRLWVTEHGPRGGDELNLIAPGGNYGWPFVTFGSEYNLPGWPPAARAMADEAYRDPLFAWVPSIGVSNLVEAASPRLPRWRGDLLVAALGWQTLYRVVLAGDRVVYAEPIRIGLRLRDLIESPSGDIWLWTDEGDLVTLQPVDADVRGVSAFASCAGCHTIDDDQVSGALGPNLYGVFGREIASNPSYAAYSDALRQLGGRWTAERLDAFLADPAAVAPGTTMATRVSSAADRQAIVEFLRVRR